MSSLEALLLGIVQGLTEFLPISSSGHLILVPWAQDYTFLRDNPAFNKTFDVALHIGTLLAVVIYFRSELWGLLKGFFRSLAARGVPDGDRDGKLAWIVIAATIPAVIVGGAGSDWIDDHLGEPWMIAIQLIIFGLLLGAADRMPERKDLDRVGMRSGVLVGIAQVLALAPGTSRSGITITAGRALGFDRDTAARFSFLLLVPATAGAALLKGYGVAKDGLPDGVAGPMVLGTIASAITGYLAIAGLLRFVRSRSYDVFVGYRLVAGLAVLTVIATGLRSATF